MSIRSPSLRIRTEHLLKRLGVFGAGQAVRSIAPEGADLTQTGRKLWA
jgi:hypothetical protein